MSFKELIDSISQGVNVIHLSDEWSQGRSAFGGLVAAVVYQAMLKELDDERPVRSLQISFVGPVNVDIPLELKTETLREGKSVSQVLGRGMQHGQTLVTIVGSFGHARDSMVNVSEPASQFQEKPDMIKSMPFLPGMTPNFTQFFDYKYCTQLPFTGSQDKHLRGFVRFKDESLDVDNAGLLALVDAWPPAPLPMLTKVAPASSLNWSIDFIKPLPKLSPGEFCQYQADIIHAENGYGFTRAKVWNKQGELIAISQQTVTIFA